LVGSGWFYIIRVRGCWICHWSEKVFYFVRLVNYFLWLGMKFGWFLVLCLLENGEQCLVWFWLWACQFL